MNILDAATQIRPQSCVAIRTAIFKNILEKTKQPTRFPIWPPITDDRFRFPSTERFLVKTAATIIRSVLALGRPPQQARTVTTQQGIASLPIQQHCRQLRVALTGAPK